jgi:hypothetical protein
MERTPLVEAVEEEAYDSEMEEDEDQEVMVDASELVKPQAGRLYEINLNSTTTIRHSG